MKPSPPQAVHVTLSGRPGRCPSSGTIQPLPSHVGHIDLLNGFSHRIGLLPPDNRLSGPGKQASPVEDGYQSHFEESEGLYVSARDTASVERFGSVPPGPRSARAGDAWPR